MLAKNTKIIRSHLVSSMPVAAPQHRLHRPARAPTAAPIAMAGAPENESRIFGAELPLPIGDVWDSTDLTTFLYDQAWFYRSQQTFHEAMQKHHRDLELACKCQVANLETFIEDIDKTTLAKGKGKARRREGRGQDNGDVKGEGKGDVKGEGKGDVKGEVKGARSRSPAGRDRVLQDARLWARSALRVYMIPWGQPQDTRHVSCVGKTKLGQCPGAVLREFLLVSRVLR